MPGPFSPQPRRRRSILTAVLVLLAVPVLVVGVLFGTAWLRLAFGTGSASPGPPVPGMLDEEAVRQAQAYEGMPILWLGKEFQGFRLTHFDVHPMRIPADMAKREHDLVGTRVDFVYGDCEPVGREPSCAPPVGVVVMTPGWVPPPEELGGEPGIDEIYAVRGVRARDMSRHSTTLWLANGTTVSVHSAPAIRDQALAGLRLANAATLGITDVRPGASLASIPFATGE